MEKTDKKECPHCGSKEIYCTESGAPTIAFDYDPTKPITMPPQPLVYECKRCKERFIYTD
jgi:hypothetical protein